MVVFVYFTTLGELQPCDLLTTLFRSCQVFRINKFEREAVPEEEFGCFFSGDSYIVQYTYMTVCALLRVCIYV